MLNGICQIEIYGRICFLEMLEYWLEYLITEDTANGQASICILANDSCQCCLIFDHFSIWNIFKVLNLISFETVVKNAREFTNIVSMHKSTLYQLAIISLGVLMTSLTTAAVHRWTFLPFRDATSGPYTSVVTGQFLIHFILMTHFRSAMEGKPTYAVVHGR